jgi:hypothetical protein
MDDRTGACARCMCPTYWWEYLCPMCVSYGAKPSRVVEAHKAAERIERLEARCDWLHARVVELEHANARLVRERDKQRGER